MQVLAASTSEETLSLLGQRTETSQESGHIHHFLEERHRQVTCRWWVEIVLGLP